MRKANQDLEEEITKLEIRRNELNKRVQTLEVKGQEYDSVKKELQDKREENSWLATQMKMMQKQGRKLRGENYKLKGIEKENHDFVQSGEMMALSNLIRKS